MNKFPAWRLAFRSAKLATCHKAFSRLSGPLSATDTPVVEFISHLNRASREFLICRLPDGAKRMADMRDEIASKRTHDAGFLKSHAWHARREFQHQLKQRKFLRVADDCTRFVNRRRLFGQSVYEAFPTAREDIKEAGNCLAAECHTAAVFHLMRAAEIGLRSLGYDRRVKIFKNVKTLFEIPLDLASWDQVIKELEGAEDEIQQFPQTLVREEQFAFYHGAGMQFKRFKNVFRNRIMHTRESVERGCAMDTMNQVREFMVGLASKIKEGSQTPVIWT